MTQFNTQTSDNAQTAMMETQSASLSFAFHADCEQGQMHKRTRRSTRRNRRWDACGF